MALSSLALVAETRKTSTLPLTPPTGRTVQSSSRRRSTACSATGMSPISSKEERAAVGLLDESNRATAPRTGKCAVGIAEEFGLDQAFGKGGAIDGDEGAGPPAGGMGVAGELFLAGTGLTADEDRHLACCRSLDLMDDGSHRRGAGDGG